jgi:hypothetical protein
MGRKLVPWIVVLSLAAFCGACSSGGDGAASSAVPGGAGEAAVLSSQSFNTEEVVTDGRWIAWVARDRERIMTFDGLVSRDMTNDLSVLKGKSVREAAYDGRYFAFKATDYSVPHGTDVFFFDAQTGGAMINASNTPNWLSTDPSIQSVKVGGGVIIWTANDETATTQLYAYDISEGTKIQLSGGGSMPDNPASTSSHVVAWSEDGDIHYVDLAVSTSPVTIDRYNAGDDYGDKGPRIATLDGALVLVWEGYGYDSGTQDIFKFEIGTDTAAILLANPWGSANDLDPAVSGSMVVWKTNDGFDDLIECVDLADPAAFNALSNSYGVDTSAPLLANGGYAAWVDGGDGEIYVADLTSADIDASVRQASMNFDYHIADRGGSDEGGYQSSTFTLGSGRVTYEIDDPAAENNDPPEKLYAYTISSGDTAQVADYSAARRVRSLKDNSGLTMWVSAGAFSQIWVQKADSALDPQAVSAPGLRSHQIALDGGVLAWSGKPGIINNDNLREIYYADLDESFDAIQVTNDPNRGFAQPSVDGVNGYIAFHAESGASGNCVYRIGDALNEIVDIESSYSNACMVDGGVMTWQAGGSAVRFCDVAAYFADTAAPPVITGIGTAVYGNDCPQIDGDIIAWHTDLGRVYYYDISAAADSPSYVAVQATSSAGISYISQNISLSDGVIAFNGVAAAGGSEAIITYSVGDPMDSLDIVHRSPLNHTDRPRLDHGKMVWIEDVGGTSQQYKELLFIDLYAHSPEVEQLTDNLVQDTKPEVGGDLVVWRQGGISEGAGNQYVSAMRK